MATKADNARDTKSTTLFADLNFALTLISRVFRLSGLPAGILWPFGRSFISVTGNDVPVFKKDDTCI